MPYFQNSWAELKEHYAGAHKQIMSAPRHQYGIDPYAWDEGKGWVWMTPIESAIWSDIRNTGIVMYPQYPACGFFLDFANPLVKVAIECDGREFHDRESDRRRDEKLEADGWRVFRLSGSECLKDDEFDEDGEWVISPGTALCRKIGAEYRIGSRWA